MSRPMPIAFLVIVLLGSSACAAETLQWPLDLPREVTSSFGEYRPGRFHAGIDLRTGGIGQAVHAAGDGYVSRVRCSPFGYGKAVYVTLDNGYTVVYGHLNDYRDDLRALVRQAQHAAENYTVDLTPKAGEFRVKRGEIIARSGQTGIGVPHLHWEIRDANGLLVHPGLVGTTWPDTTRPILQRLLLCPVNGTVNGDVTPQVIALKAAANGQYTCEPIAVSGGLTFAIETYDPASGGAKLGIHEAIARMGDNTLFTMRNDHLDYASNDSGTLAFYPYLPGQFLALWRAAGNASPSYQLGPGDGVSGALQADTTAGIEVRDEQGNTAKLSIPLHVVSTPVPPEPTPQRGGNGSVVVQAWGDYLTFTYRFEQPEGEPPQVTLESRRNSAALPVFRVGQKTYRAIFKPEGSGQYTLRGAHPRAKAYEERYLVLARGSADATLAEGDLVATLPGTAPFETLILAISAVANPPQDPIRRLGPAWHLGPENQPLREGIQVSLPVPSGAMDLRHAAIYRSGGSGWSRLASKREGDRFVASSTRLGIFAVLEDATPPVLSNVVAGAKEAKPTPRPELRARISDTGSGIETFEIRCGTRWLLTEYDPETASIRWEQDEDLPRGTQEIVFLVSDGAGNVSTTSRSVFVP